MNEDLEQLRRWEDSGAPWQVVERAADGVVVRLLMCTGDEEVARIVSADPEVLAHVGDRDRSDD
ncbi:MAG: hypothetical protein M3P46_06015 [Actinomycetota bacterium]|nr:hypothetical protein [Actinomycetota bacterium]